MQANYQLLYRSTRGGFNQLAARQLSILSKLSGYAADSTSASQLIPQLIPYLKNGKLDEGT
jgi:hypothetical protein